MCAGTFALFLSGQQRFPRTGPAAAGALFMARNGLGT